MFLWRAQSGSPDRGLTMHWKGSSSSPAYSAGWGLWFITRRRASLPLPRQITSTPGAQACLEFRLCHYHLGQDEQPVSLQLASRRSPAWKAANFSMLWLRKRSQSSRRAGL